MPTVNDGFKVTAPRAADMRYGKIVAGRTVPFAAKAEALALIPNAYRHIGLTVNIDGAEYWWKSGVSDEDLIIKFPEGTIIQWVVKEPDVGQTVKEIDALAGQYFFIKRDIADIHVDVDFAIMPGGGFYMINPLDTFVLGQTFTITVLSNLIKI